MDSERKDTYDAAQNDTSTVTIEANYGQVVYVTNGASVNAIQNDSPQTSKEIHQKRKNILWSKVIKWLLEYLWIAIIALLLVGCALLILSPKMESFINSAVGTLNEGSEIPEDQIKIPPISSSEETIGGSSDSEIMVESNNPNSDSRDEQSDESMRSGSRAEANKPANNVSNPLVSNSGIEYDFKESIVIVEDVIVKEYESYYCDVSDLTFDLASFNKANIWAYVTLPGQVRKGVLLVNGDIIDYTSENRKFRLIISNINYDERQCTITINEFKPALTGYGKIRPTFTMDKPATYITFNSITDNPDWGDERGFVLIKDVTGLPNDGATACSGGFRNEARAIAGHTYMVKMFIHNNAADNYSLIAKNTRVFAIVPTTQDTDIMIQGQIAADNCGANWSDAVGTPDRFWDEAYLTGESSYEVSFISDSARLYNNVQNFETNGFKLPDTIVSNTGALVGYMIMDGSIPGCFQYSGYVTFLVTTELSSPSFTVTNQVRIKGQTEWRKEITANPSDHIEYRIDYDNVGTRAQNQVIIQDRLSDGVAYVDGSAFLYNSNNPRPGLKLIDTWITSGFNIGNYAPGANAIIEFEVIIPNRDDLEPGENLLQNLVIVYTDDGTKYATANVIVTK